FSVLLRLRPPRVTRFPYTTLFRSSGAGVDRRRVLRARRRATRRDRRLPARDPHRHRTARHRRRRPARPRDRHAHHRAGPTLFTLKVPARTAFKKKILSQSSQRPRSSEKHSQRASCELRARRARISSGDLSLYFSFADFASFARASSL